jgi:hypothetical protein
MHNTTLDSLVSVNRAGKNETCISPRQIIRMYCHRLGDEMGHRHREGRLCRWDDEDALAAESKGES